MMDANGHWSGTLICLFQPNEEGGAGAQAMVDDGLYDRVPVPDIILGQHVDFERAGELFVTSGVFMASANSFKVTIIGRGGHGSQPQFCVDPILIAGYIIVRLQSIVSRMVAPLDTAVVTCGSVRGGDGENVIPDKVELKLNVRTYSEETRKRVLDAIYDIIKSECKSAGAPQEPIIEPTTAFPLTDNDKEVADTVYDLFHDFFGPSRTKLQEKLAGSEDISNLARPNKTPYAYWFLGATDHQLYDEAKKSGHMELIPRNHSGKFAPVIEPTMTTGVQALALAALYFLT
jgi:amidohydrolase